MPKRRQSFRVWQMEKLSDPERAVSYLNVALNDSTESFLVALGKVAQARQMTKVAEEAGVKRESLYRSLSSEGNPTIDTLTSVLGVLGLRMTIATAKEIGEPQKPSSEPIEQETYSQGIVDIAASTVTGTLAPFTLVGLRHALSASAEEPPQTIGPLCIPIPKLQQTESIQLVWTKE